MSEQNQNKLTPDMEILKIPVIAYGKAGTQSIFDCTNWQTPIMRPDDEMPKILLTKEWIKIHGIEIEVDPELAMARIPVIKVCTKDGLSIQLDMEPHGFAIPINIFRFAPNGSEILKANFEDITITCETEYRIYVFVEQNADTIAKEREVIMGQI